ncbi:putative ATPase [Escherichia coli]|uniref:Putative ATPase n=1 Tax=Escherichia coli TaxID=562 RepID=A0A376W0P8_ECOLX|nr:putative ATPase [Escherichia coli]
MKSLSTEDIEQVLTQAMEDKTVAMVVRILFCQMKHGRAIAELVNGDARRALNTLEMMADMAEVDDSGKRVLKPELLTEIAGERSARFDNKGDRFYDLISALHKSVRGSAPDAALYWYARIITAGGDPLYVARRCLAIASEDVGNADPRAMQVAMRPGIALLALARRKVNAPLLRRLFTWPVRQKATLSTLRLKPRWPMLANVRIMTCRFICVMRRRN